MTKKLLHKRTIDELAKLICGPTEDDGFAIPFSYRSETELARFFAYANLAIQEKQAGQSRLRWVASIIEWYEDPPQDFLPNKNIVKILRELLDAQDFGEYQSGWNETRHERYDALETLNRTLARDNLVGFFDDGGQLQLKNSGSAQTTESYIETDRPWSEIEYKRKGQWDVFLKTCSEDDFIEKLLVPLFRQMGFKRVKPTGHKDKALEFGKDIWMKFQLPSGHFLWFGLQAKKDKLDAKASGKNLNVATIIDQINMLLSFPIFDEEIGRKVLVDHIFIAAAGDITKQARELIAEQLDATKRRTIIFLQRDEILSLTVDHRVPFPGTTDGKDDDIPF